MIASSHLRRRTGFRGAIKVQRAEYTFNQLAAWRDSVFNYVLTAVNGVATLDMDEERNRVTIGLEPGMFATLRSSIPKRLVELGVDTNALNFVPAHSQRMSFPGDTLSDVWDTLVAGIKITNAQHGNGCTLGLLTEYADTIPAMMQGDRRRFARAATLPFRITRGAAA